MKYDYPNVTDEKGGLHSVYPCTLYLTFGYWIYLVPQYRPKSVLMLGYAGGTVAGLIRLFYGDVPITAVDSGETWDFGYGAEIVKADAREFVKTCGSYDAVIVDLFTEGSQTPPAFVYSREFADNLKRIANYIIIYSTEGADLSAYHDLHHVKTLTLDTGAGLVSKFEYFMVHEIPSLPIR